MSPVSIDIAWQQEQPIESVGSELDAVLTNLGDDLGLDVTFNVELHHRSGDPYLYVDGTPLHARNSPVTALGDRPQCLMTLRMADHLWESWGGASPSAPAAFVALLRRLVRYRLRPDRVAHAVPTWADEDPIALFENALNEVDRTTVVHVDPDSMAFANDALAVGPDSKLELMSLGLFYELGIFVGECTVAEDRGLRPGTMSVRINDVRSAPEQLLTPTETLVNDTVARLRLLDIDGREAVNPANGNECAIVPIEFAERCEQAGLTTWDTAGWLILATSARLRAAAAATLSSDTVELLTDKLNDAFPYAVDHVRAELGNRRLAAVLRYLLDEEISIRNSRHIMDNLLMISPVPQEPIDPTRYILFSGSWAAFRTEAAWDGRIVDREVEVIGEGIRQTFKRYISQKYTRGQNTLVVYLLDPAIESRMRDRRPLTHAEQRSFLDAIGSEIDGLPTTAQHPCVLTTAVIRRRLWRLVEGRFPHLAVLSYQELAPDINIQPLARIAVDGELVTDAVDLLDRALAELRYDAAHVHARDAAGSVLPKSRIEPRLMELVFFWNEAGRADRVEAILDVWSPADGPSGSPSAESRRDAIRAWLSHRDRLLFRRLQHMYRPVASDFVAIGGGAFEVGDPVSKRPAEVDDFAIARLPVTGRQFALYLHANDLPVPTRWIGADEGAQGITWQEAVHYCAWLSTDYGFEVRLPTEVEWEYAASGGASSEGYRYAGSDRLQDVGDVTGIDPVGVRRPNELGIYDMSGGRAEWCAEKVARGGDITGAGVDELCTVWARELDAQKFDHRSMNLGFRLVRGV